MMNNLKQNAMLAALTGKQRGMGMGGGVSPTPTSDWGMGGQPPSMDRGPGMPMTNPATQPMGGGMGMRGGGGMQGGGLPPGMDIQTLLKLLLSQLRGSSAPSNGPGPGSGVIS